MDDPNFDVMGVKLGMTFDQLPPEFRSLSHTYSKWTGAIQVDKCFPDHKLPPPPPQYGEQAQSGDACIFIFFTDRANVGEDSKVFAVLLLNYAVGSFQFIDNAAETLTSKYGAASEVKRNTGSAISNANTVLSINMAWNTENSPIFGPSNPFQTDPTGVLDAIYNRQCMPGLGCGVAPQKKIAVGMVYHLTAWPTVGQQPIGAAIGLIDIPTALANRQGFERRGQQEHQRVLEQDRLNQSKPKF